MKGGREGQRWEGRVSLPQQRFLCWRWSRPRPTHNATLQYKPTIRDFDRGHIVFQISFLELVAQASDFRLEPECFSAVQSVKLVSGDFTAQGNPSPCALVGLCHLLPVRPVDGPFIAINKHCPETGMTASEQEGQSSSPPKACVVEWRGMQWIREKNEQF